MLRLLFSLVLPGITGFLLIAPSPLPRWNESTPLTSVLAELGDSSAAALHTGWTAGDSMQIRQGYELVHSGFTTNNRSERTERISRFFVCTDCHNTVVEDPDLRLSDPEARLRLAAEKGIPFLQGTTLKGVVNRESWYNGDYVKKYGERAVIAHDDIRQAIQLCAEECSQGRALEEWELRAVLAYLQSIELTLGDLMLSTETWERLSSIDDDSEERRLLIAELKSYYLNASPATFLSPPEDLSDGYDFVGASDRGEAIYRLSCLHCHAPGRVTRFELENDSISFKKLSRKIHRANKSGFYQVIREGTTPGSEHPQYMPRYPAERLSDRQIEDLRAYVEANVMK